MLNNTITTKSIWFIIVASLIFSSCKKDSDDPLNLDLSGDYKGIMNMTNSNCSVGDFSAETTYTVRSTSDGYEITNLLNNCTSTRAQLDKSGNSNWSCNGGDISGAVSIKNNKLNVEFKYSANGCTSRGSGTLDKQ